MTCDAKRLGCGGCPLLEMPYPEQLRKKQALVKKHLSTFGKPRPILGMEAPFHYRNKAIASFAYIGGQLISGIYREGTHRVAPVEECLLHEPGMDEVLQAVRETARELGLHAFNEDKNTGTLRHALLRRGHHTGQMLLTVVTAASEFPGGREFVSRITAKCPQITSIVQNVNPRHTSAVLGFTQRALFGPGYIEDTLCGLTFRISSRSFYQVNTAQTEVLYREAIRLAELTGRERVIDAYCGIGTLGLAAANQAGEVLGIELNPAAVEDAKRNAGENGIKNARFLKGDAGQVLSQMAAEGQSADVVFLDPPRAGSDEAFLSAVCELSPRRVVYVSCNVETQARDLRFLHGREYRIRAIQPVDMFPHTEHVETVCLLNRPT